MGMRMPETCWAVFKWQVINLRSFCIWLVDSVEGMMMHRLANPKWHSFVTFRCLEHCKFYFMHSLHPPENLPDSGTLQTQLLTIEGWIPCCQSPAHCPALEELQQDITVDITACSTKVHFTLYWLNKCEAAYRTGRISSRVKRKWGLLCGTTWCSSSQEQTSGSTEQRREPCQSNCWVPDYNTVTHIRYDTETLLNTPSCRRVLLGYTGSRCVSVLGRMMCCGDARIEPI